MSVNLSQTIIPRHLGIIMDGNGRWAQKRGLPRIAGHQEGVQYFLDRKLAPPKSRS